MMNALCASSLPLVVLAILYSADAYQQSVTVTGSLYCGDKPTTSKNTWVKILNKRTGFDDQKETSVNDDGTFKIVLTVNRLFRMDPEAHIYTDCNDQTFYGAVQKGCQRKIKLEIPDKFAANSGTYDLGKYNLETKFHDEGRDCSITRSSSG